MTGLARQKPCRPALLHNQLAMRQQGFQNLRSFSLQDLVASIPLPRLQARTTARSVLMSRRGPKLGLAAEEDGKSNTDTNYRIQTPRDSWFVGFCQRLDPSITLARSLMTSIHRNISMHHWLDVHHPQMKTSVPRQLCTLLALNFTAW